MAFSRALPASLHAPSRKQKGKIVRKAKEKNAMTEMRRFQKHVKFVEAEADVKYGDESEGLEMLAQAGDFQSVDGG